MTPVRVVSNSVIGGGVKLDVDRRPRNDAAAVKLRRLLCCRKRDKVLLLYLRARFLAFLF